MESRPHRYEDAFYKGEGSQHLTADRKRQPMLQRRQQSPKSNTNPETWHPSLLPAPLPLTLHGRFNQPHLRFDVT